MSDVAFEPGRFVSCFVTIQITTDAVCQLAVYNDTNLLNLVSSCTPPPANLGSGVGRAHPIKL